MHKLLQAVIGAAVFLLPTGARADSEDRLGAAATDVANWLTYGHGYSHQRFSPSRQIHRGNVARLVPKWIYQTGVEGSFQTSPIVHEGVVYLSTPRNHVVALDGATGAVKWKYTHKMATTDLCCGIHNRGVAIGYGRIYQITADARLIALDRQTGNLLWDEPVIDPGTGARDAPAQVRRKDTLPMEDVARWPRYMGNMAPLVFDGMVIVGTTGAGYTSVFNEADDRTLAAIGRPGTREGMRAFISAYEAATGRLIWRWYATKDEGWEGEFTATTAFGDALDRDLPAERASAAQYRDAWKRGGGSIIASPALDPALGLIYFGTGNAAPYADRYRPGDNLYTASLVALDVKTGELRWYHQVTPHDVWGYDLAAPPILLDAQVNGATVPAIAQATKSGWIYLFDRRDGSVLRRSEGFVPQTNLFRRARDVAGVMAVPGEYGGANWPPTAYSPDTGWLYVAGAHLPSRFALEPDAQGHLVNVLSFPKDVQSHGTLSAIDPDSGAIRWQQRLPTPFTGGLAVTAGGLLYMGEADGHFSARDVASGELLWRFQTGAGVIAPPVTYEAGGRSYVIVAAGGNRLFNIPGGNAVVAFGLQTDEGR